jgi:hypothetical protein
LLIGEVDTDADLPADGGETVRVDYDRARLPADCYRRVCATLRWLRLRPVCMVLRRTARGWHLKVRLTRRVSPLVVVALQAILGSDPRRETFNLIRARALRRAPRQYRSRYSVLFRRKL